MKKTFDVTVIISEQWAYWPFWAYWSFWSPVSEEHPDQCILHLGVLALLFLRTSSGHDQCPLDLIIGYGRLLCDHLNRDHQIMIGLLPGKALCWGSYWPLWLARINLGTTVLSIETFKNTNDIQKHPHSSTLYHTCLFVVPFWPQNIWPQEVVRASHMLYEYDAP